MSKKAPDPLFVLRTQRVEVTALCFHDNGDFLFSGGIDGSLTTWNLTTRRLVGTCQAHFVTPLCSHPAIQSLFYTSLGLVSQGRDGTVKLWDLDELLSNNAKEPLKIITTKCTTFVSCSLVQLKFPLSPRDIQKQRAEYSPPESEQMSLLSQQLQESGISKVPEVLRTLELPLDPLIAVPSENSEQIHVWNIKIGDIVTTLHTNSETRLGMAMSLQFIQQSNTLLLASTFESGSLFIWDILQSDRPIASYECFTEPALCCTFNGSGSKGIVAGASDILKILSFSSHFSVRLVKDIRLPRQGISHIDIRADQKIFATAGWDHRVRIFSVKSGKPLAILKHHAKTVHSLAFSPNPQSNFLASGSSDSHICIWSIY